MRGTYCPEHLHLYHLLCKWEAEEEKEAEIGVPLDTQNQMMQGSIDAEVERQGNLGKNKSEPNLDNKKNGGKTEAPEIDIKKAKI